MPREGSHLNLSGQQLEVSGPLQQNSPSGHEGKGPHFPDGGDGPGGGVGGDGGDGPGGGVGGDGPGGGVGGNGGEGPGPLLHLPLLHLVMKGQHFGGLPSVLGQQTFSMGQEVPSGQHVSVMVLAQVAFLPPLDLQHFTPGAQHSSPQRLVRGQQVLPSALHFDDLGSQH